MELDRFSYSCLSLCVLWVCTVVDQRPVFFEWNDLSAVCSSWNRADLAAKKTGGYDSCHMLLCFEWLLFLLYDRTCRGFVFCIGGA